MKSKVYFLTLVLFLFSFVALADQPPPRLPIRAAVTWVAGQTGLNPGDVIKNFKMKWLWIPAYDDDQPIDFYFLNAKVGCSLEIGSNTLIVRSGSCAFR